MSFTLAKLSELTATTVVGDPHCEIDRVDSLCQATGGAITFFADAKLKQDLKRTRASAVILKEEDLAHCPAPALLTDNPYLVFARIAGLLNPPPVPPPGVHPSAVVSESATLGEGCSIGPGTVIDDDCVIGNNTHIGPNCCLHGACEVGKNCRLTSHITLCERTVLGRRVIIHPGVVVGSDGFGLASEGEKWVKIPQLGRVRIGDDVEIGANTTIDCGALEDTVLEEGVKLDNQIQVAHNVRIGAHTVIAGCTGVSGSTTIGRFCRIGGASAIGGHLQIADHVTVGGMTRVGKSIDQAGTYVSGTPMQPYRDWLRSSALYKKLGQLAERIKKLEEQKGSGES